MWREVAQQYQQRNRIGAHHLLDADAAAFDDEAAYDERRAYDDDAAVELDAAALLDVALDEGGGLRARSGTMLGWVHSEGGGR